MKKALVLLFSLLLVPSLVFADVIVEPENGFYRSHQKDCQHREGRTYLADGPDGILNLYTAPNGTVSKTLENGDAFFCQWTYTDKEGVVWGFSEKHEAWAPLGYTQVRYDHISFREEHGAEITEAAARTGMEYETVYLYEYPVAPDPIRLDQVELTAEQSYIDDQGRQWGYVSYIYGIRNKWFCLDDPASEQLTGAPRDIAPSGFEAPASLPTGSQTVTVIAVVAGIAAVTLIAVLFLFRRKWMLF